MKTEDVPATPRRGDRDEENQFRRPTGTHPDRVSSEFTPLIAEDWQGDMKLFIKTC